MKCFRCGAEVRPPARFCGVCGTLVADQEGTLIVPPDHEDDLLERVRRVLAGEYEVENELARGGMAVVYKATEVGLKRAVALKVLPPDLGLTIRAVERFKREARTVAELDHPNIIPVYRVGQVGGVLHIAMKFVEGRSLDVILADQGALPVPVVLYVLRGVTRALAYAHDRGIVHRDVKGGNVMVDVDGRVMVADFGVALRATDVTLTMDGSVIGTPPFMSPEQCGGRRAGPQSDQYSVGVLGFQMLAGSVPFHADTLAGIMQHHFFTPPPDLHRVRDDVPDTLVALLQRALAKDPERRFPTTRAMLSAVEAIPFSEQDRVASERVLQTLARGERVPPVSVRAPPPLPEAPTQPLPAAARPWSWWGSRARLAGVVATALVGLAAWWVSAPARRPEPPAPPPVALTPPETVPAAAAAPRAAVSRAKLRMSTDPPNAEILIDGRRVGIGVAFDVEVPAGSRRLQVQAPGYRTFDTTVVFTAPETQRLGRIALRGLDKP
jgi:tRNA A-37 threonylcarbamoyl transferase component Bud32